MPFVCPGSGTHTPDTKDVGGGVSARAEGARQAAGGQHVVLPAAGDLGGILARSCMLGPLCATCAVPDCVVGFLTSLPGAARGTSGKDAVPHIAALRAAGVVQVPPTTRRQPAAGASLTVDHGPRLAPTAAPVNPIGACVLLHVEDASFREVTGARAARERGDEDGEQEKNGAAVAGRGAAQVGMRAGIRGPLTPGAPLVGTLPPRPPVGWDPAPGALRRV